MSDVQTVLSYESGAYRVYRCRCCYEAVKLLRAEEDAAQKALDGVLSTISAGLPIRQEEFGRLAAGGKVLVASPLERLRQFLHAHTGCSV